MYTQISVSSWAELENAIQNALKDNITEITVTSPIVKNSTDKTITILEQQKIIIKALDSSELSFTRRYASSVGEFIVSHDAELTLIGKITVSGGQSSNEKYNYLTGANFVLVQDGGSLIIDGNISIKTALINTKGLFSFIHCLGNLEFKKDSSLTGWTINVNNKREGNVTEYSGAAIKLEGEKAVGVFTGTSITNCINTYPAKILSSSIQVINGAKVYLNECSISECGTNLGASSQGIRGGALYLGDNSYANISNSIFENNKACEGGCLYVDTNATAEIIDNSVFRNNLGSSGGALYLKGIVRAKNVIFSSNRNNYQYGSAIFLYDINSNITADNISVVDNLIDNKTNFGGGAIYSFRGSISIKNSSIKGNRPLGGTLIEFSYGYKLGGGFNLSNGSCYLDNTVISNNWAMSGAGIFSNKCEIKIINCIIDSNESTKGDEDNRYSFLGGGIYASEQNITIKDSKIINNTSKYIGGGLFLNSGNLFGDNILIQNNSATGGGGFYLNDSTFQCDNIIFDSNKAVYNEDIEQGLNYYNGLGGAIYNLGVLYLNGGRFINNKADLYGNGIYQNNILYLKGEPYFDATSDVYLPAAHNRDDSDKVIIKCGDLNLPNQLTVNLENPIVNRIIMVSDNQFPAVIAVDLNDLNVITNNDKIRSRYLEGEASVDSKIILGEIATIRVSYLDEIMGQCISETRYIDSFLDEEYEVLPVQIDNYNNTGNSGNTTGILTKDIAVDFYYTPIPPKCFVEVNYYLYGSNTKIKSDDFLEGNLNDFYNVAIVPINGYYYNYHIGDLNGIYTIDTKTVKLFYTVFVAKGTVRVKYIDKDTQLEIHTDDILDGNIGSPYSVSTIALQGYYYDSASGPLDGIFANESQVIILSYIKAMEKGTVRVRYIDKDTQLEIHTDDILDGNIGSPYSVSTIALQGYYYDSASGPLDGIFANESQVIILSYIKAMEKGTVRVKYIDKDTQLEIHTDDILDGNIGSPYSVLILEITNYVFVYSEGELSGFYQKNLQTLILYYQRKIVNIINNYISLPSNQKILESSSIQGHPEEKYEIIIPTINNYIYKYSSDNLEGKFSSEDKTINHYFTSQMGFIEVRHIDYYSGKAISNFTIKSGVIGTKTTVYAKSICNYCLSDNNICKNVVFKETTTILVFYYKRRFC